VFKIYLIKNTVNEKIYVGKTSRTIEKRWQEHVWKANGTKRLYALDKAIRKYGSDAFVVREIDSCNNEFGANLLEAAYIMMYMAQDKDLGYNLALGGQGCLPSSEVLKKRTAAIKRAWETRPELRENHSRIFKGRKHGPMSPEARENMSKAHLGTKTTEAARRKQSEAGKRRFQDPSLREKMRRIHLGKKLSPERCEAIRQRQLGRKLSDETKQKLRLSHTGKNLRRPDVSLATIMPLRTQGWSLRKIARQLNTNHGLIRKRLGPNG
jgi:group I intron endonuclease